MLTFMWFALIVTAVVLVAGCGRGPRMAGVSWFDLLPFMRESKKATGRRQQTARHGARRF